MAEITRPTPTGWEQIDDTDTRSRVTPTGWTEIEGEAGPTFQPAWAINSNQVIQ